MRDDFYPPGTVRALLDTDLVSPATRQVLQQRLDMQNITEPDFFTAATFATLQAVSMRLIPQHNRHERIDLAGMLDKQMKQGNGDGWRYDSMPPDNNAFIVGLEGINETSRLLFNAAFHVLNYELQDHVLRSLKCKMAPGETWKKMPSHLFFEELLAALVEIYYSHPFALEEIGVVAAADAKGWEKIQLNQLEAHEPKAKAIAKRNND